MTQWISWSSLRTHMECKQRNFLNKSGKRAPLSNQRVFFPGTVVDRVVRDWLYADPENTLGQMPSMVEETIIREKGMIEERGEVMKWKDGQDHSQTIRDCIEAVTNIEADLVERVLPYEYQVDFRFRAPLWLPTPWGDYEAIILNGAMDILTRDPKTGQWRIDDVKMTRDSSYYKKTAGQLSFYDLVVKVLFGEYSTDAALLQPLASPHVKEIPIDSVARSTILRQVTEMATDVWNGNTEPRKDNKFCNFCDVKHACTKFQPVVTSTGKRKISFNINQ